MHNRIIKILESEANSAAQGLIYIHREGDKWYAYEQSAFLLSEMMKGQIVLNRYVVDKVLWLARAEVDIDKIPPEYVICYGHDEYVLHYLSEIGFYDWISNLNKFQ